MVKVSQSTTSPEQNRAQLMTSTDQLTLRTCARTSLDPFGDSKGRFGIFTLGSSHHGPIFFLSIIRRPQDERMKVIQSSLVQNSAELILRPAHLVRLCFNTSSDLWDHQGCKWNLYTRSLLPGLLVAIIYLWKCIKRWVKGHLFSSLLSGLYLACFYVFFNEAHVVHVLLYDRYC